MCPLDDPGGRTVQSVSKRPLACWDCGFESRGAMKIYFLLVLCFVVARMGEEGKNHWGDLGVDRWIILRWIYRKWDVGIWTGLGWPRVETVGVRL